MIDDDIFTIEDDKLFQIDVDKIFHEVDQDIGDNLRNTQYQETKEITIISLWITSAREWYYTVQWNRRGKQKEEGKSYKKSRRILVFYYVVGWQFISKAIQIVSRRLLSSMWKMQERISWKVYLWND